MAVVKVELLVPAYLYGDLFALVLDVKSLDYLPEGAFVYNLSDKIPVTDLFTNACPIIALEVRTFLESLSAEASNRVDLFKLVKFCLLKRGQFIKITIEGFIWGEAELHGRVRARHSCCSLRSTIMRRY